MKAAIYCRLSEEDKDKRHVTDDSESIQNQKSMLIQYATEQGWEIYGIYSDDDYTGADRSRPEFNRLLEDAKHKKFDIVLCKTQSRFTTPPRYLVFFKGRDADALTAAFKEFSAKKLTQEQKPSIRKLIVSLKDKAAALNAQREKVKKKDREVSL